MSEAKHTPGPWVLDDRGCKYIVSKAGDGYITRDVCRMDGSTMASVAQTANAHLIAAAPELLEALEKLAVLADAFSVSGVYFGEIPEHSQAIDAAYTAIAKAKGEEHDHAQH